MRVHTSVGSRNRPAYHDKLRALYGCLVLYKTGFESPLHTCKQQAVRGSMMLTIILAKSQVL